MTAPLPDAQIAIVGAGLSGLAAAARAQAAGLDWRLLEARARVGGRAFSPAQGGRRYDLGPAWIWPGDARARALAERLGLPVFEQASEGRLIFEDASGAIRRDLDMAPMAGSLRLAGGLGALAEAAAAALPADRLHLDAPVAGLRLASDPSGPVALLAPGEGAPRLRAAQVVLALPPRLAAGLAFAPALPEPAAAALRGAPGWMAAQAKLVAVYPAPFWRAAGLSGDAISHRGPLAEVHDASPLAASAGALFGFLGVPPQARAADPEALKSACLAQLARLFGPEAAAPDAVLFKDWAADPATAAPRDLSEPPRHPPGGLPPLSGPWSGRLRFAGSEHADPASGAAPGYVEGALAAGEAAADAAAAALAPGGPARP